MRQVLDIIPWSILCLGSTIGKHSLVKCLVRKQKTIHSGPQDSWWAGRGVWRRGGEYELLSWAGQWLVLMGSEINQQTLYRNQNP